MIYDVIVIGGGPSGMSAALAASDNNANVLLLERDIKLGGILNQCIHNGFGLHYFGEELTGPEYAEKIANQVLKNKKITVFTETFVNKVTENSVEYINSTGKHTAKAKAIVLSMGCREKTAGSIALAGSRPAGVFTAGLVQKMINHYGKIPGKRAVILGSGDIGLIMCRRLIYEGVKVEVVLEIMNTSSGLARNIQQCVKDYSVPLLFNHTITRIIGKDRVEGVYYAQVDKNLKPIKSTEKFIKCDTVLLSVGLVPENDLVANQIHFDAKTKGAVVNEYRQTSTQSIFASGNVLHIHDLADNATIEGAIAGKNAALYSKGKLPLLPTKSIVAGENISYTIPQLVTEKPEKFTIYFRLTNKVENKNILVWDGNKVIAKKFIRAANPGEMQEIEVDPKVVNENLFVTIKEM